MGYKREVSPFWEMAVMIHCIKVVTHYVIDVTYYYTISYIIYNIKSKHSWFQNFNWSKYEEKCVIKYKKRTVGSPSQCPEKQLLNCVLRQNLLFKRSKYFIQLYKKVIHFAYEFKRHIQKYKSLSDHSCFISQSKSLMFY